MRIWERLFKRWYPASDYEAALSLFGDGSLSVSDGAAMRLAPAYRACTMVARDIARAPRRIRIGDEFQEDTPFLDLLRNPHPTYNGNRWFSFMIFEMLSRGQSLAVIIRDGRGEVISLTPIPAGQWSLQSRDGQRDIFYRVSGLTQDLSSEDVLHFRLEDPGGWWVGGKSPFHQCNGAIQQLAEQQTSAVSVVQNLGRPRLAVRIPGKPNSQTLENVKESFRMSQTGASKAGSVMVLPEGMELQEVNPNVVDAEFESARRYSVDDVSRLTGVPASLLANRHDVKYSTLSDEYASYVSSCLSQYAAIISGEFGKLLGAGELVFDFSHVLRPSQTEQMNAMVAGVNAGILNVNEARRAMNLSPNEEPDLKPAPESVPQMGENIAEGASGDE